MNKRSFGAMKTKPDKLEAVTVCIFYSDFLKYCINNKKYLDRWIIVTVENDIDTIQLCKDHSLEFICSKSAFNHEGTLDLNQANGDWVSKLAGFSKLSKETQEFLKTTPFNDISLAKGKCINDGLSKLERTGWLLHLDCDVVLPDNIRKLIDQIPLTSDHKKSIFGLRGRRILGAKTTYRGTNNFKKNQKFHAVFYKEWLNYIKTENRDPNFLNKSRQKAQLKCGIDATPGSLKSQWEYFVEGNWSRLVYPFDGPDTQHLGFFQLFHSSHCQKYFELSKNIYVDDVLFRESFPKNLRHTLNVDCVHVCLPSSGMVDLLYLDQCVLKIKHQHEFSYLNKISMQKKIRSSRLITPSNLATGKINGKKRSSVRSDFSKLFINSLNLDWSIWKQTILRIKPLLNKVSKDGKMAYQFLPNPEISWFGFSLFSEKTFDKTPFSSLSFELKAYNLNCSIEVGYGDKFRTEWIEIRKSTLKNNTWCKFRIDFSKENPLNLLNTLFSIRSRGDYSKGNISVREVFFQ
jgi:hypothetical protein